MAQQTAPTEGRVRSKRERCRPLWGHKEACDSLKRQGSSDIAPKKGHTSRVLEDQWQFAGHTGWVGHAGKTRSMRKGVDLRTVFGILKDVENFS